MKRVSPLSLTLLAGALAVSLPAHAIEEEAFTLRASVVRTDAVSELTGRTEFLGEEFRFTERFDFGSEEWTPRLDAQVRLGERHRLVLGYFNYDKSQRATLDEAISFDDVTLPAGSYAESDVRFELASLLYDFSLVEQPRASFGLQLGVQYARLRGSLYAEAGDDFYREEEQEDGFLPTVGARLALAPADPWRISLQVQHLDAGWVNDDDELTGTLTHAQALVEYRFTPQFGAHLGYDWNRLDIRDEGSDGIVRLDQRFRGPMAGVTFAF